MKLVFRLLFFFCFFASKPFWAQSKVISLNQIFKRVSENHPSFRLANLEIDKAEAYLFSQRGGFDPSGLNFGSPHLPRMKISDLGDGDRNKSGIPSFSATAWAGGSGVPASAGKAIPAGASSTIGEVDVAAIGWAPGQHTSCTKFETKGSLERPPW